MTSLVANTFVANTFVADTHALFWYLTNSPKLSKPVNDIFERARRGEVLIYIPAIVLAELYYLNEKLERRVDFAQTVSLLEQSSQFVLLPFAPQDVKDFALDQSVSEMHDRIVVGVTRRLKATCLTVDVSITRSKLVPVLW